MAKRLAGAAGKSSLDMAMAALAAASVGFVTFAMPDDLFAGLVTASGLPALLPAAEPPLGTTARLAVVAAAAIGAFLLVSLALRALGQPAGPKAAKAEAVAEPEAPPSGRRRSFMVKEEEAPRIRRADAHPDAPARRPLFAGSDLGEPLDAIDASEPEEEWTDDYGAEADAEPLPEFMTGEASSEPPVYGEYGWQAAAEEPEPETDAGEQLPEEAGFTPEAFEPAPYQPPAFELQPCEPEPREQPADIAAPVEAEPAEEIAEYEEREPLSFQPRVAEPPRRETDLGEASISELMQRLERGLQRRGQAVWEEQPEAAAAPEPPFNEEPTKQAGVDDRLRSALDDLQKMASRGGQA